MKYSKVKDKPIHRLKAMQKKLRLKAMNILNIGTVSRLYGIPLSEVTLSAIKNESSKTMHLIYKIGLVINLKKTGKSGMKDIEQYFNSNY